MTAREKLLAVAGAEVGYLEKATNADLDSPTGNAGKNNFTKYARDLDELGDFYNGKKNGYSWCDVFVDWCFVKAFGAETALKLLCAPKKSCGAGCKYSGQYYKKAGRFVTADPQPGDQIFFGSGASWQHTGLVEKVDSTYIHTIEGNTSTAAGVVANGGGVCRKKYRRSYAKILGYGRPDWTLAGETEEKTETTPKADPAKSFDKSYSKVWTVKVNSVLNLRTSAAKKRADGSLVPIVAKMKNGEKFRCYGYYTKGADGTVWLYGVYNGKTGYCDKGYLR